MTKPNGRPATHKERNAAIIRDYKAGMGSQQLAKKYGLAQGYAQKIASEYARKERIKKEAAESKREPGNLFLGLDMCLWNFVAGLHGTVRKHTEQDGIRTNKGYAQRAK